LKKLKVLTIIGTRPETIRLSRVIAKLEQYCAHVLVHTGQNYDYELNEVFFEDLGLRKPDHFLNCAGASSAETIGKVIAASDRVIAEANPDALLVLGDTNSCLAVISAKRRRVPVFHMEAGNRCFDDRVPEEINRRIVDHTADVNLTYSQIARQYLLSEGLPADRVIWTGSPMLEVLTFYRPKIESSTILERMCVEPGQYFVFSSHREENVDDPNKLIKLVNVLNGLVKDHGIKVIVSTHPRTRSRLADLQVTLHSDVLLERPLSFTDYVKLQISARAVLSDSGTITEESSILNFPALNLREAHERPEGMEEGAVMMVGLELERIRQALAILKDQKRGENSRNLRLVSDYSAPNVSDKMIRIIHSYADYVGRTVWKRY
jgi:UDP-N-acetylglucosamine 2-epimerase (non-hydrolysing)